MRWIVCLLLLAFALHLAVACKPEQDVEAAELPLVVTVQDEQPQQPEPQPQPSPIEAKVEIIEPPSGPTLEERVALLESTVVQLAESDSRKTEGTQDVVSLLGRLSGEVERLKKVDQAIVEKIKTIRSCECEPKQLEATAPPTTPAAAAPSALQASAAVPLAPAAPMQWQKTITMATESWCAPCQAWKTQEQSLVEQDGYMVIPQPSGGGSVPRFRVQIGHLWADHTGYLTRARLKQIEQTILERLQRGE